MAVDAYDEIQYQSPLYNEIKYMGWDEKYQRYINKRRKGCLNVSFPGRRAWDKDVGACILLGMRSQEVRGAGRARRGEGKAEGAHHHITQAAGAWFKRRVWNRSRIIPIARRATEERWKDGWHRWEELALTQTCPCQSGLKSELVQGLWSRVPEESTTDWFNLVKRKSWHIHKVMHEKASD